MAFPHASAGQGRNSAVRGWPAACKVAAASEDQESTMSDPTGTAGAVARSNVAPRLAYDDLRQWLNEARKLGEVRDASGLNWQQEIGAVSSVAMHDDAAPCFVFNDVPDTIKGSRVLVNFFGGRRKNMTFGFSTDLSKIELSEGFRSNFIGP